MAIRKIGKTWYVDIYKKGRRIRKVIGPSKKLAKEVELKWKVQIAEGKFESQRIKDYITFDQLAKRYLVYARANKKSWKRDVTSLNKLRPVFGHKRLNNISPFDVEEYKQKRIEQVSVASVNRELACMKHMFNLAIKWGKAKENPVKEVKMFKEKTRRLRYLNGEEIKKLEECCSPQLKPVVITAWNTGMRLGEILGLRWDDVDFNQNLIFLDDTKSGSPRQIPISDYLKETLLELKKNAKSDVVFLNRQGKPYRDVREAFKRALEKAGIFNFRFHDLRHTFASQLAMMGIPLVTIKELLGHKTIQMTLRYSHLSAHHKQQAVNLLQRRISSSQKMVKSEQMEKDTTLEKP